MFVLFMLLRAEGHSQAAEWKRALLLPIVSAPHWLQETWQASEHRYTTIGLAARRWAHATRTPAQK